MNALLGNVSWRWRQSSANLSQWEFSLLSGKIQGTFADLASKTRLGSVIAHVNQRVTAKFPAHRDREFFAANR